MPSIVVQISHFSVLRELEIQFMQPTASGVLLPLVSLSPGHISYGKGERKKNKRKTVQQDKLEADTS